ncbi:MAG TPA: ABC transporter substrate-binding protein [Usitatibacter sp.]|nr:ABC transporter substrate-binding protein [Usitatibacter sp.]
MKSPRTAAILLSCASLFAAAGVSAEEPTTLRVITFPSASYSPLFLGVANHVFEKRGIHVELSLTPDSKTIREGLARGDYDITHTAVDNAIAMVEDAHADVVIVTGGDTGMNELIVRPEIGSFDDLRGKSVVVDAPNTAYALLAKKILKDRGLLPERDYKVKPIGGIPQRLAAMQQGPENAAAMLGPPFSFAAKEKGMKSFGRSSDLLGPYQAGGAFVMRKWAAEHGALLERYIAAYVECVRMARDPANREQLVSIIETRLKQERKAAEQTYAALMEPGFGLAPDARFDMEGFKAVLKLRAEIEGQWGGTPPAPDKYLDLGYYDRAMKLLAR